jgi:hypothetical protein
MTKKSYKSCKEKMVLRALLGPKAELLQLNRTQFPSLGIFVSKKVENQKTKTTFIISVLKVVY